MHRESKREPDEVPILEEEEEVKTVVHLGGRCVFFFHSITLEILMFLFIFSYTICGTVLTNLMIDKACLVHFNLSKQVCNNLRNYTAENDQAERLANSYNLYSSIIQLGPAAVLSLFIGPWSDRNGRKPLLKVSLFGFILQNLGLVVCAFYYSSPLLYIVLVCIPSGLTGNILGVLTNIYSCVSDVSSEASRTVKYTLVGFAMGIALPLGTLSGGLIYSAFGYVSVFATAAVGHFLALLWVSFAMHETCTPHVLKKSVREKILDFFSMDGIRTCLKKRRHKGRTELWLLMGSMGVLVMTYVAQKNVDFIFTHHMYNWEVVKYSEVSTIFQCISECVGLVMTPFLSKVCKVSDPVIGLIGTLSLVAQTFVKAFAERPGMYYIASSASIMSGMAFVALKSRLSKTVDKDEMGRTFAVLACFESLFPLIGIAIFTASFNATMNTFPGATYLGSGVSLLLPLIVFFWIALRHHMISGYIPQGSSLMVDTPSVQ